MASMGLVFYSLCKNVLLIYRYIEPTLNNNDNLNIYK